MPAYLETEQELSRLARKAAGMRGGPRLLILPGIMGSSIGRLRKTAAWTSPGSTPSNRQDSSSNSLAAGAVTGLNVLRFAYEQLRLCGSPASTPPTPRLAAAS
jgi:hypothetical protein